MIIKSTRVGTGDAARLAGYFSREAGNEAIAWARGSEADLLLMDIVARTWGRPYAIRHVMISPQDALTAPEVTSLMQDLVRDYAVPAASHPLISIVRHLKPRREGTGPAQAHLHLAIPEVDAATGRVLPSRFSCLRNEKIARRFELRHGRDVIPGAHNAAVYRALEAEEPGLDLGRFRDALIRACITERGMKRAEAERHFLRYRAPPARQADVTAAVRPARPGSRSRASRSDAR